MKVEIQDVIEGMKGRREKRRMRRRKRKKWIRVEMSRREKVRQKNGQVTGRKRRKEVFLSGSVTLPFQSP